MLLGQLYHYEKQLDQLQPNRENLSQIELLGIAREQQSSLTTDQIIDLFIQEVEHIFETEKYTFNLAFWRYLKSVRNDFALPLAKSEFQAQLLVWVESGYLYSEFEESLKLGSLTVDEADFALYYTLKALNKMLGFEYLRIEVKPTEQDDRPVEIPQSTPILVVTKQRFFPLYKNLGIEYSSLDWPEEALVEHVLEEVRDRRYEVVLLDGASEAVITLLQKKLKGQALVSRFSLEAKEESGYFDKIVKDTLGVRLVD